MVLGLCRLLLRDPVEAEDAAQQTFLSAHRSLLRGAGPREPAPWLAAIARNECLGRIRERGARETVVLGDEVDGSPDPLAEAIRNADLGALWRTLGELPRRQRRAFLLRELSGLSYGELARALAVSEPAVESLLFRARRHVRTRLAAAVRTIGWPAALGAKLATAGVVASGVAAGAVQLGHDRPPPPRAPVVRHAFRHVKLELLRPRRRLVAAVVASAPRPAAVEPRHAAVEPRRHEAEQSRRESEPASHETEPQRQESDPQRAEATQQQAPEGESATTQPQQRQPSSSDGGRDGSSDGGSQPSQSGSDGGDANSAPGDG